VYFELIVASCKKEPTIFMWEQKTNKKFVTHLVSRNSSNFKCGGWHNEADAVFKPAYKGELPGQNKLIQLAKDAMLATNKKHPRDVDGITTVLKIDKSGVQEVERYLIP
jgi:hypothetical protein